MSRPFKRNYPFEVPEGALRGAPTDPVPCQQADAMPPGNSLDNKRGRLTRRQFIKAGGAAALAGAAVWGRGAQTGAAVSAGGRGRRPNILFISCDELGIEALSGYGCAYAGTPNIDRLIQGGTSFMRCYTADPLCSPARSSWFTGRMPSETGVVDNDTGIRDGMATMGHVLRAGGYDTYYCGKWHLPEVYSDDIPGFRVLPAGIDGRGYTGDTAVSQACAALLGNRAARQPFLMVTSLLEPHDICSYVNERRQAENVHMPEGLTEGELPELPPNFEFDKREPRELRKSPVWSPLQWRLYLWTYYRHVEMVDAEIGRILDALEDSPHADNTMVIFAADHGEGQARHKRVLKNVLYDEAARVPLVVKWAGRIAPGVQDTTHLTSSTDILPTMCDYAGAATPERVVGRSVRPLLEGNKTQWRDMVAGEVVKIGRMVRTEQYKFITYRRDSIEQLFDMRDDPWETKNLAREAKFASVVQDHRKLLHEWEGRLDRAPLTRKKARDVEDATE